MQRRRGYMQFLILVLLLILEGAAIPKLQNDASYFSLGKSVVSEEFFRSHELTEEMVLYLSLIHICPIKGMDPKTTSRH